MRRLTVPWATGLAVLGMAVAASAQEVTLGPPGHESNDFRPGVAFHGRFVFPFGSADRDIAAVAGGGGAVVRVDEHLSWSDLFHPGWGAEVELDLVVGSSRDSAFGPEASFRYGAFAALALDHFEGDIVRDGSGAGMEVEDLDLGTLLAGGKIVTSLGDGSRVDGRIGLGVAHYSEVDAVFSGPGVPAFRTEFLEETWTLAGEVRGHWGIELGPLAFVLGMGFRAIVPPTDGSGVDLSAGAVFTFDIDVGIEIGF